MAGAAVSKPLIAPFPYFGGKSRIAHRVLAAIGEVQNYVEPFAGSLAVLLARKEPFRSETVNDLDGFVCNFWRALKHDPESVAVHATNPVNENDLHARHAYLLSVKADMEPRLSGDPDFYDAKLAGWWAWGTSCWIGSGLCSGEGAWRSVDGRLVKGNPGTGNKKQLPHLGGAGRGVTKQLPHLGDAGAFNPSQGLLDWFAALAHRLRTVRVCCGSWDRVLGPSVTIKHGLTGVFLDPPYGHDLRATGLYANDHDVTAEVGAWAKEWGQHPQMRIVLAGYEGEYDLPGWAIEHWKTDGGMAKQGEKRENARKERLWISPHCAQSSLFEGLVA